MNMSIIALIDLKIKRDKGGNIVWKYNNIDELCHYGILGMKWHNHKMKLQQYNNELVKNRRLQANDNVKRLEKFGASKHKIKKAKIKANKIERSKYGQTRGQILGRGIIKSLGASFIGGAAYKAAVLAGSEKAGNIIKGLTAGYKTANTIKTGYKLVTNYDAPTKKSGTRISYK